MRTLLALLLAAPHPAAAAPAGALEALWQNGAVMFDSAAARAGAPVASAPRRAAAPAPMRLSELRDEMLRDPRALDDLLDILVAQAGPMGRRMDTPEQRQELKDLLRGADAAAVDAFPTVTAARLAEAAAFYAQQKGPNPVPQRPALLTLSLTGTPAAPSAGQFLRPLGHGLHYGDESLAVPGAAYGDSVAVAAALEQLAALQMIEDAGRRHGTVAGWLGSLLASGHTLEVRDRRMYANFGDLRFDQGGVRRDVATPTLVDTGVTLAGGRRLVVPVTHSELDISVRGPRVNAELSWFFGVDGLAAFRAYATQDQSWVGGRTVRTWRGIDAARILDRAADVAQQLEAKARALGLPMGGYGPLGSCNDVHGFVTGGAPFGMVRDPRRYAGADPLDRLSAALPFDVTGPVDPVRVWESRAFEDVNDIPLPELRATMLALKAQLGR
jgi:hypothetical protein